MRFGLREIIFFAILLAVPVASFLVLFKPRNEEITEIRDEIQEKQVKLDRVEEVKVQLDDIALEIEKGREAIESIEHKLPSAREVATILDDVTRIAQDNMLSVKSVKPDKEEPAAAYMEQPIKVEMEGEFEGFYQFLLALESLPRITRMHNLKMEKIDGADGPASNGASARMLKIEFDLSIYFEQRMMAVVN